MPASEIELKEATGQTWDEWFTILDEWGARDRKHGEIVGFFRDEQDVASGRHLPDADEAEAAKTSWRRRLTGLKAHLES